MTINTMLVLNRASALLQDADNTRWPAAELFDWLNDGQREIALLKPNACVKTADVALAVGVRQNLPAGGLSLVDIPSNTSGGAIRIINRALLDAQVPDWRAVGRASINIQHYCYSELNPKQFLVYPSAKSGASVEMTYNALPTDAVLAGVIGVDDIYMGALLDYVLYRAFSKDSEHVANATEAQAHYTAFRTSITGKAGAENATDPNWRKSSAPSNSGT